MRTIKRAHNADARIALFQEHADRVADLYTALHKGAISESEFETMRDMSLEMCNAELRRLGLCK